MDWLTHEILASVSSPVFLLAVILVSFQILISICIFLSARAAGREAAKMRMDVFGMVKKVEAMTAARREHFVHEYDKLVGKLSTRLPTAVANQVGTQILETERQLLSKLAELEHGVAVNPESYEDLLVAMEELEATVIKVTGETTSRLLAETRDTLLQDERFADL